MFLEENTKEVEAKDMAIVQEKKRKMVIPKLEARLSWLEFLEKANKLFSEN